MEAQPVRLWPVRLWIKRSTWDKYAMILRAAKVQAEVDGEARPTTVSFSARVPYKRAKEHMRDLEQVGLLEFEQKGEGKGRYITVKVTEKGTKFIELYDEMQKLLGGRGAKIRA